jgi:ArsR family transcriptional regulator
MISRTEPSPLIEPALAEGRAGILRALGNPARLRLTAYLCSYGEQTVGDMAEALSLPQSTVSRQLAWLKMYDMVSVRVDGNHRYYSVVLPQLRTLLECLQGCNRHPQEQESHG